VRFAGTRRDLGDVLAALDVFVLPSLWEGLPLSLILAMGAGRAVVVTAVGGVPEIVRDGATGLVVAPGDPKALGGALARLVCDPAERDRLGKAAREFALPRFSVDGYVTALTALYERLLEARAA
jgi:glycosyltransferase involved in cell wall biosynthesis